MRSYPQARPPGGASFDSRSESKGYPSFLYLRATSGPGSIGEAPAVVQRRHQPQRRHRPGTSPSMLLAEHRAGIRQNVKLASPTVMPDMASRIGSTQPAVARLKADLENASRRESETRESSYQCEEEFLIALVERTVDEDVGWPGMATPGGHRGGLSALCCLLVMPVSLRARAAPLAGTRLPRRLRLVFDEPDTLLAYEYRIRELGHTLELGRGHPQLLGGLLERGAAHGDSEGLRMTHEPLLGLCVDQVKQARPSSTVRLRAASVAGILHSDLVEVATSRRRGGRGKRRRCRDRTSTDPRVAGLRGRGLRGGGRGRWLQSHRHARSARLHGLTRGGHGARSGGGMARAAGGTTAAQRATMTRGAR